MSSIFDDSDEACAELEDLVSLVVRSNISRQLKKEIVGLVQCYVAAVRGDAYAAADILEELAYDRHEAEHMALDDIVARKDEFTQCKQTLELWATGRGYWSDSPYAPGNTQNKESVPWDLKLKK